MQRRVFLGGSAALPFLTGIAGTARASAQTTLETITLPKPQTEGGGGLMTALSSRRTTREISDRELPPQMLANILWAAFGVNREDGKRTAPTAVNVQDTDIYVFLADGVYLYDAPANALKPVIAGDHRALTGKAVAEAPVSLVYVANLDRYEDAMGPRINEETQLAWSNAHVGFIAQNVYLYAASEGLGAGIRALFDKKGVATLLKLEPTHRVLYAQTVGYPK